MLTLSSSAQISGVSDQQKAGLIQLMLALNVPSDLIISQGMPVILAPNGTVATNGTITLGTALPAIYAQCWLFLPAGAVVGGAAGLYYAEMSSTTVGIVKTGTGNTGFAAPSATVPFQPSVPSGTLAAVVGSNAGYTTVVATDQTLLCIYIPANSAGLNGLIRSEVLAINNNSAGAKIAKVKLGASTIATLSSTTDVVGNQIVNIRNRGNAASQVNLIRSFSAAASVNSVAYSTVNTAADTYFQVAAQIATATDYVVLEGTTYELMSNPAANIPL